MKKSIFTFCLILFAILSCEPESQTDYVNLEIPVELRNNKEAVKRLESDAKQLNRIFNSLEEMLDNIIKLKTDINAFEESDDIDDLEKKLNKRYDEIGRSYAKFGLNILWLLGKDYVNEKGHQEILKKLSRGETIHYTKCLNHLSVKKEVIDEKIEQFAKEFDELGKAIDSKKEIIERKREEQSKN